MAEIKLYLDEDVSPSIARILRGRGYDVISAQETGMFGKSDEEQLEFACNEKRVVFTFNVKHYASITKKYFFSKKKHFGIVVSKVIDLPEMIRLLISLLENSKPQELENSFRWLQEFKQRNT